MSAPRHSNPLRHGSERQQGGERRRRAVLGKLKALSDAYFAQWVEYRAELSLWVLAGILPLILMGVWAEVSQRGDFPLSRAEFIRYFLAVFMVRQLTFIWVIWEFEELVVTGKLSPWLLQPIDPIWRFLVEHVTERVTRLPLVAVIVAVCFALYPESIWLPDVTSALTAFMLLATAFFVRFLLQYAMSMLAFWSERATSIEELWFMLHLFLSGLIAPLEIYPEEVRVVAELTPFPYLIYYPARVLIGHELPLGRAVVVLLAWGAGAFVLYRFLWRRGLRRYSAMGA